MVTRGGGHLSESQQHLQCGLNTKHVAVEKRKQDCRSTNISTKQTRRNDLLFALKFALFPPLRGNKRKLRGRG